MGYMSNHIWETPQVSSLEIFPKPNFPSAFIYFIM